MREHVISTVMVLLLGGALLCALAFSTYSPRKQQHQLVRTQHGVTHQIDHHQFTLPSGWYIEPNASSKPLGHSQLTLYNQQDALRVLDVGVLPRRTMRTAAKAMEEALALLHPGIEAQPLMQTRTRQGSASGYMQVSLLPMSDSAELKRRGVDDTMGMISHLFVYSDDGREYVAIHHYEITEYDPNILKHNRQRLMPAMQLILAIAQASHDTRYRYVNQNDLINNGFASNPASLTTSNANTTPLPVSNDWRLRVSQLPTDDDVLQLLPYTGSPNFWIGYLRGALLPAPSDNEKTSYDGQTLLRYLQDEVTDDSAAIVPIHVLINEQTITGWKLVTQLPSPVPTTSPQAAATIGDGLVREHWYLPLSDRRVLVAQLIAEPEAIKEAGEKLTQVAVWLHGKAGEATVKTKNTAARQSPQDAWSLAISRGEQVVQDIRSHASENYTTENSYHLFQLENRPIGFTLAQDVTGDEPLTLRGRQVTVVLSEPRMIQEVSWSSDASLSRMWLTSRTSMHNMSMHDELLPAADASAVTQSDSSSTKPTTPAPMKVVQSIRKELRDGVLTSYDLHAPAGNGAATLTSPASWSYPTPANYLHVLGLDLLSPAFLERWTDKPPALIMYAINLEKPEPCWFEVHQFETLWRVTIRPLADALSVQYWFNPEGVCGQSTSSHYYPNYGGPWRYTSSMMQRDVILNAFEQLKPDIIAWEKEWQTHEKPSE